MDEYLECQSCGVPLYGPLGMVEQQKIADNPYNFVGFCLPCKKLGLHIEPQFRDEVL